MNREMKLKKRKLRKTLTADFKRDVQESYIREAFPEVLDMLLKDRTTGKNIMWCTKDYESRGEGFGELDEIRAELISKPDDKVIVPRACKRKEEQRRRVQQKGEVFTPAWICNAMNSQVDNAWFGRKNAGFNHEVYKGWKTIRNPIRFTKGKTWQEYVTECRLEITCGEAPFIVSRYDMASTSDSDEVIPVVDRIGLLDRKLRVVTENCKTEEDWVEWAEKALKAVLAYEWQGDNLFIARENVLWTMIETADAMMGIKNLGEKQLLRFAEIISWNVWQMDGLKCVIPMSCHDVEFVPKKPKAVQLDMFATAEEPKAEPQLPLMKPCPGCAKKRKPLEGMFEHNGIYCQIMDWDTEESYPFTEHFKKGDD